MDRGIAHVFSVAHDEAELTVGLSFTCPKLSFDFVLLQFSANWSFLFGLI